MTKRFPVIGATLAAALATPALALPPLPDWQQLEAYHQQDKGIELAQRSVVTALPVGTPVETARAALAADGARCRPARHRPNAETCLIHQYSLLDGAADDVRWTLTLIEDQGRVSGILVDRSIDRHGSA
ncbi:hypothetical protein [Sphingomonas oryzagri]|jgi:hypothetical protein|uniref:PepSY domain-containing protein n=1 Tax=Sphingomonas oryzagri TaxID=3042314 RepID=A0ABT6N1D6_9SPHN|nr:hypothetical protein [Sphingomonas oryzagri]MDH7639106.1 hypothetical protein [Sphingomonas oryzagri]